MLSYYEYELPVTSFKVQQNGKPVLRVGLGFKLWPSARTLFWFTKRVFYYNVIFELFM